MSFKHFVRNNLPPTVLPFARSVYNRGFRLSLRPRCAVAELREALDPALKRKLAEATPRKLPPPLMRYQVGEDLDPLMFIALGRRIVEDIERCVAFQGEALDQLPNVLDFGCGCGRTLLQLIDRYPKHRYVGTDINAAAIDWCQNNLKPAEFLANRPDPPMDFETGRFDLIYAISVFTHLDRTRQEHWIPEFTRLLRPGGLLIVTVHGETAAAQAGIRWADLPGIAETGVSFLESDKNADIHPDWYQTSFNHRPFTEQAFGQYFTSLMYVPGIFGFQDAMVCRKPLL